MLKYCDVVFQENFDKEIASQENAQFSVCQAEMSGGKMAVLENQQDIKVWPRDDIVLSSIFVFIM